jgi:hypothetical protein
VLPPVTQLLVGAVALQKTVSAGEMPPWERGMFVQGAVLMGPRRGCAANPVWTVGAPKGPHLDACEGSVRKVNCGCCDESKPCALNFRVPVGGRRRGIQMLHSLWREPQRKGADAPRVEREKTFAEPGSLGVGEKKIRKRYKENMYLLYFILF